MVFGLNDAFEVVIQTREHGRAGTEAEQAAFGEGQILRAVVRSGAAFLEPPRGSRILVAERAEIVRHLRDTLRRSLRHATIGRVDDYGCAVHAVDLECIGTRIDPERVVAANVTCAEALAGTISANRRCFPVRIALALRGPLEYEICRPAEKVGDPFVHVSGLAQELRAFQGSERTAVVGTGQIGNVV